MPSRDHKLFSIVIPTFNEGERLHRTVESILNDTTYTPFEVIVVDDGSTDGSCDRYADGDERVRVVRAESVGIPRARNLGAGHARGEYVLFIDAHCTVSPDWLERFVAALHAPDVGIVGPAFTRLDEPEPRGCGNIWINHKLDCAWLEPLDTDRPYEVPITPGGCQAFRKKTFDKIGGFDAGFTRWGYQDEEICLRAWLLGYRVLVDPRVTVAHYFRTKAAYSVADSDILLNFLRMIHLHLSPPRIRRCIAALGDHPGVEAAIDRLFEGDIFEKRAELLSTRYRSDDWFFKAFTPNLA